MKIEKPPNRLARVYHVRQDLGEAKHWSRSFGDRAEGIASLIAEVPGVDRVIHGGYEILVLRSVAFTDEEVFKPVEAMVRAMEEANKL